MGSWFLTSLFLIMVFTTGLAAAEECTMHDVVGVKGDASEYDDASTGNSLQECKSECLTRPLCILTENRNNICYYASQPVTFAKADGFTISYKDCSGSAIISVSSMVIVIAASAALLSNL